MIAYYENRLSQEQADELLTWLEKDKQNQTVFLETGEMWYASGLLSTKKQDTDKAFSVLQGKIRERKILPFSGKTITIGLSTIYKVAAAIFIVITIGTGSFFLFTSKDGSLSGKYFIAEAPRGSRSVISLPDGSSVWLNSGTKLTYPADFGDKAREVTLEGEAFFSVAKNRNIPFRVTTSDIVVTALGTSFNVKAYSEEAVVEATLETGEVRIDQLHQSKNSTVSSVFLKPNQKALFIKSTKTLSLNEEKEARPAKRIEKVENIIPGLIKVDSLFDTRLATSWKDSRWIFRSEKLQNLAPILERRYDVTISFRDSVLCNYRFTGTLKEETLEQVMTALCIATPTMKYEISDHSVVLFSTGK
jgi:ferric-dicitrate binding protein FerR (iron transport regulator)